MHDYSFWCPVVTVGALFTDGRMDGQIIGSRTRLDDISTAELKALSCAKKGQVGLLYPLSIHLAPSPEKDTV